MSSCLWRPQRKKRKKTKRVDIFSISTLFCLGFRTPTLLWGLSGLFENCHFSQIRLWNSQVIFRVDMSKFCVFSCGLISPFGAFNIGCYKQIWLLVVGRVNQHAAKWVHGSLTRSSWEQVLSIQQSLRMGFFFLPLSPFSGKHSSNFLPGISGNSCTVELTVVLFIFFFFFYYTLTHALLYTMYDLKAA